MVPVRRGGGGGWLPSWNTGTPKNRFATSLKSLMIFWVRKFISQFTKNFSGPGPLFFQKIFAILNNTGNYWYTFIYIFFKHDGFLLFHKWKIVPARKRPLKKENPNKIFWEGRREKDMAN
jgi:hypothetical protein